jgi:hypothetical protein
MSGQWIGPYAGTNSGLLVLELDDVGSRYEGFAFAHSHSAEPVMIVDVRLEKNRPQQKVALQLLPMARGSGNILSPEDLAQKYPELTFPTHAESEWEIGADQINITWLTSVGTSGTAKLEKSKGGEKTELVSLGSIKTWEDFRRYATTLDPYRFLFRGQENSTWKLRTSFYRTGRASILKFSTQDLPSLHRQLSGLTSHRFDLGNAQDYAAFLNLAQHHGYPTPSLDWTQSPFIAAYFAYRDLLRGRYAPDQKVRIHIFDGRTWNTDFERASVLSPGFLHITALEPLALDNPRALPQQSISTVTNVDDMEDYISKREAVTKKGYLSAIDLPAVERKSVIRELDLMGINAGSLFPGLDGACGQLRERFFDL